MSKITSAMAVLGVVAGLGVAALPLSSYAQETSPVTVKVEVNNNLAIASNTPEVDFGTLNATSEVQTASAVISVSGTVKYKLSVKDTDGDPNMNLLKADKTFDTTNNIPASASLAKGTSAWGIKGGNLTAWTALPGTGELEIATGDLTTLTAPQTSIDTTVDFGISIGTGLTNGVYQNDVIFTALETTGV